MAQHNPNSERKNAAVKIVKDNPDIAAKISKLVIDRSNVSNKKRNTLKNYSVDKLKSQSDSTIGRIHNIENNLQLFPDMDLAMQILVSSVLSPKDMVGRDLLYSLDNPEFPAEIANAMLETLKTTMNKHYKFKNKLYSLLYDALFITGSYPMAVLPESSIDRVINSNLKLSHESLSDTFDQNSNIVSMGLLGGPEKPSEYVNFISNEGSSPIYNKAFSSGILHQESSTSKGTKLDLGIEVYDNFNMLKLPNLTRYQIKNSVKDRVFNNRVNIGAESNNTKLNFAELFNTHQDKQEPQINMTSNKFNYRDSIGRPLVAKIPSESVIPIHVPGDPETHLAYFILMDETHNPITKNNAGDITSEGLDKLIKESSSSSTSSSSSGSSSSVSSYLVEKARKNITGNKTDYAPLDDISSIFSEIIIENLQNRLINGIYGRASEVTTSDDINRVMLYRTLKNKKTKVLLVPYEIFSYFAYKYYSNGQGKTMLADTMIISNMRAILMFAKLAKTLKNSISVTSVNLKLAEHDPDPVKSIERVMANVLATRQQSLPIGIMNPSDLVDWVHRAGFEFNFTGHPGLPDMELEFDHKNPGHILPDDGMDDDLRKQNIMSMGLTPEMVDEGFGADFAATIINNNLLLTKRVIQIQDIFNPQLTEHHRRIIEADPVLQNELLEIIRPKIKDILKALKNSEKSKDINKENIGQYVLDEFIKSIVVELPKPDTASLATLTQQYNEYSTALDSALEAWVTEEMIDRELAGDLGYNTRAIISTIKAYFLRKWQSENNYMAELTNIILSDEEGKPLLDLKSINDTHIKSLINSFGNYIKNMKKVSNKANEKINKVDEPEPVVEPTEKDAHADELNADSVDDEDTDNANVGGLNNGDYAL